MCISYICNQSSSDFGNFFASYLDYRACTLLIYLLRRTTIVRQLGSHSIHPCKSISEEGKRTAAPSYNTHAAKQWPHAKVTLLLECEQDGWLHLDEGRWGGVS